MAFKRHDEMHQMEIPSGIPWLMYPLTFHSSREHTCDFNDTAICDWQYGYWLNWYKDDLRYALPTVAFFMSVILLFVVGSLVSGILPRKLSQSQFNRRLVGLVRYFSYRAFRISPLNWNSAPIGILLLGALGAVYFFSMTLGPKPYYWPNTATVNFGNSPAIATRSGWLSIACMPFVFATAGKSNFITAVTGISHERLQVFHRWIAYAFLVTALVHTFPFIVYHIQLGDMVMQWKTDAFYWTGVAALVPQCYLTFASFSPLRNLSYEWFKFSHFLAALCFMVFFFFHCAGTLTSWEYFVATGVLFSLSWLHRQIRIYFEHGINHKARLNLDSNGFIHVAIPTKATWEVGQHFFIRFLSLGLHAWTIHPFTACSLPERAHILESKDSELIFYIRPQKGFTSRLARHIALQPNCTMRVLLDGPYGGIDMKKIEQCQRQVVIAGGSGAGWIMPMIIAYLRRLVLVDTGTEKSQSSLKVILATRDPSTRSWFEEKVQDLLQSSGFNGSVPGLDLALYYTGYQESEDTSNTAGHFLLNEDETEKAAISKDSAVATTSSLSHSSETSSIRSIDIRYYEQRPDLTSTVRNEAQSTGSDDSLGVFVCGPLSMQHDVANEVAAAQIEIVKKGSKDIYLHMEHFAWA